MKKILETFDYLLLICVLVLIAFGIAFIYSSGVNSDGLLVSNEYVKQIIWSVIGLVFLIALSLYDYRDFERYAPYLYLGLIAVLVYTRLFGRFVNGARSWIGIGEFGIQPSEFGKIIFILALSKYLAGSAGENQLRRFVTAVGILFVPVALILLQPDLGTASVYVPVFFFICLVAGIPIRYIFFLLAAAVCTMLFTILPVWNESVASSPSAFIAGLSSFNIRLFLLAGCVFLCCASFVIYKYFSRAEYYFWIGYAFAVLSVALLCSYAAGRVLKAYQLKRLIVFLNPSVDPLDAGWNIIQSKTAIGSGGLLGRSFLHGTQSHLRFLPQQSTDFIFSIISEETGFVGGLFVYAVYLIIMLKTLLLVRRTPNQFGSYIAAGILGIFMTHFFVNIGMVIGIMPITGIPLLFLSYGGSSLLTAMACVGLLMSIRCHRNY